VLSPDGTFVVIGSAGRTGEVRVVSLRDGRNRAVTVGARRTALPLGIGADDRSVLLATSDAVVDRYADGNSLRLARLDIETGQLRDYPAVTDLHAAALSPDGSRIVATSGRGAQLIDAATGRVAATFVAPSEGSLDGDAWSPDGTMIAMVDQAAVAVVDVTGRRPLTRRLPLTGMKYGSALGWRDESTVLVHGVTNTSANTSELYWVDVATGQQTSVASYTPNFTGASLIGPDAARDLVPVWRIEQRTVDRGRLPLTIGLLLAVAVGLAGAGMTTILTRYRAKHRPAVGFPPPPER
jgi:dipeptidyl aminopeptidase/acylaminoacyl peptidase